MTPSAKRLLVARNPSLPVGSSKSKQNPLLNPLTMRERAEFFVPHSAIKDLGSDSTATLPIPRMSGFFPLALTRKTAEDFRFPRYADAIRGVSAFDTWPN